MKREDEKFRYPAADWRSRAGAAVVDAAITLALFQSPTEAGWVGTVLCVVGLVYVLLRDGLGEGQSLGKRALGIQVINVEDRRPAGARESALRNAPLFLAVALALLVTPMFVLLLIPEAVAAKRDERGRRLGDRLAGTQVIDGAFEGLMPEAKADS